MYDIKIYASMVHCGGVGGILKLQLSAVKTSLLLWTCELNVTEEKCERA